MSGRTVRADNGKRSIANVGMKQTASVSRGDDRFVGRRDERAAFEARLDDALRRDGSVMLLSGDAGIGKTSLIHVWLESARVRGFATANVANFPFARDPYAPIAELCRTLARLYPRAVPRGEGRALFTRFLNLLPPSERRARCRAVAKTPPVRARARVLRSHFRCDAARARNRPMPIGSTRIRSNSCST